MYRDLFLIGLSLLLWGVGETAFFSFEPLYLEQLGASPIQIGAILGGYGIAGILVHMPAGYLADRLGRKPVMLAGWITGFLSTALMFYARSLPLFVTGMIVYASTAFVVSPMNSYVTSARGNLSVARSLTFVSIGFNLGAIIGPLIGGIIGDRYGFRQIYLFALSIFVFSNILIFFIKPQPIEHRSHSDNGKSLLTNTSFIVFLCLLFFTFFATYLPQPLAPNYLQNDQGYNLVKIGRFYSINAIGIVFFNLVLGQMEARTGFVISQVFMIVFSTILWKASGEGWFAIAFFLLGSFRATRALATALIRTLVKPANMGLAFGIAETMGALALILAPLLAGYLYDLRPLSMFSVSLVLTIFSILFSIVLIHKYNKIWLQKL